MQPGDFVLGTTAEDVEIPDDLVGSLEGRSSIGRLGIIIHGHQHCTGNPVEDNQHKEETLKAAKLISGMVSEVEVKAVFINNINSSWIVDEL